MTNATSTTEETIVYCYVLPCLCVVGIIGNIANLFTLASPRLNAVSYMYLRGVAVADLLCMFAVLGFVSVSIITHVQKDHVAASSYSVMWYKSIVMLFLINWPIGTATLLVTSLTLERYISVCWPIFFRQWNSPVRATVGILFAYFISIILHIPMVLEHQVVPQANHSLYPESTESLQYKTIASPLVEINVFTTYKWIRESCVKFIPILAVAFFNLQIIISLRRHRELRARLSGTTLSGL